MLETITQLLNRGVDVVEETYKIIDFTNLVKSVTEAKTRQRTWKTTIFFVEVIKLILHMGLPYM
jgi:hypothetical protein